MLGPRRKQSAIIISVIVNIVDIEERGLTKYHSEALISKITIITSSNKHTTSTSEW